MLIQWRAGFDVVGVYVGILEQTIRDYFRPLCRVCYRDWHLFTMILAFREPHNLGGEGGVVCFFAVQEATSRQGNGRLGPRVSSLV